MNYPLIINDKYAASILVTKTFRAAEGGFHKDANGELAERYMLEVGLMDRATGSVDDGIWENIETLDELKDVIKQVEAEVACKMEDNQGQKDLFTNKEVQHEV